MSRTRGRGERAYAALLLVYPSRFRQEYGGELSELFRLRRDQRLKDSGGKLGPSFWGFIVSDAAATALSEWWDLWPKGDGMRGWIDDFAYASRRLARSPGFSAIALLILILGIGVNSTAFSVVNSLLFQPPPFEEPERLVDLLQDADGGGPNATSYPAYLDISRTEGVFESVAAATINSGFMEQDGAINSVLIEYATARYMAVLGLAPSRGRWFDALENEPTGPPAAVITHKMWRDRMGADPDVLGQTVRVGGSNVPIVGVGPEEFNGGAGPASVDMWMSISAFGPTGGRAATFTLRGDHWFRVRARLLPGVTVDQARTAMNRLADDLARTYPEVNANRGLHTIPVLDTRIDPQRDGDLAPAAALLMAVVALVLIIGTLNLANLLLVRSTARAREIAVRLALGAGRGRLVRVVLSEALVLAALGGLGGLGVAVAAIRWLGTARIQVGVPLNLDIRLDTSVLLFTFVISVATGLVFGLVPALRATARNPGTALHDDATVSIGARRRFGLTGSLVAGQIAVTLLLLAVASVFVESLVRARSADPGFSHGGTAYVQLTLQPLGIESFPESLSLYREIEERMEALPEVSGATISAQMPAAQFGTTTLLVGAGVDGVDSPREVPWNVVVPDYFEVLGVPLLHGRTFLDGDIGGADVAIVSEAFARGFWGRTDIVGETFRHESSPDSPVEIVGVAGDVVVRAMGEAPTPSIYRPHGQWGFGRANYIFRTDAPTERAVAAVRDIVRSVDPRIPVLAGGSLDEHFGETLQRQRIVGAVLSGLGGLALLLAVLGVYGVVSFAVSRRRQEVGIRIALGADGQSVVRLFIRDVATVVIVGAVLGLAIALPAGRFVGTVFTGGAGSPLLIGTVAVGLLATALLATLVPALRATRTDPRETLHQE